MILLIPLTLITKSAFKSFLQCPESFWFLWHQPGVLTHTELNDFEKMLAEQGKAVEARVYNRFPETVRVRSTGDAAVQETNRLIHRGVQWIGQAAFATADFFAQADLIHVLDDGRIDIYEIKSSSGMQNVGQEDEQEVPSKEKHIADLAFQYCVAKAAGYDVATLHLVEINKEYRLYGVVDIEALLVINNVTAQVLDQAYGMKQHMNTALEKLESKIAPTSCGCKYLPRKKQCPAFSYLHPQWMDYAVYDLARIGQSKARLISLVDAGYVLIRDIPADYALLDGHRDQVHTWNTNEVILRTNEINAALSPLVYPLYFLDYETTSTAIPVYAGTKPYMQVPFQYSLHIIHEPGGDAQHVDYLHVDRDNPMFALSDSLRSHIGDEGTVMVWNKTFESKCNQNMASVVREHSTFLYGLNDRMYDLMEIFSKRHYVHRDFKGSHSIKKVLPVLVPGLTYKDLAIADGGTATTQWKRMVFEFMNDAEKQKIKEALLEYCKLDTLAMVQVYKAVHALVK
jgi:hypothetical protein